VPVLSVLIGPLANRDLSFVEDAWRRVRPNRRFFFTKSGAQIMSARPLSRVLCCLIAVGVFSPAHALSQEELIAKLESAGYSQIRDIKSTAEGISVKATKDGKEVSLVVDSTGQVKERR
jgi:Peptidase propeptide and YPEB domain